MTIEQKNMEAILNRYPELHKRIQNMPASDKYQIVDLYKNGKLNIIDKNRNVLIYDKLNPYDQVLRDIVKRQIRVPNFAIFLGLGCFYSVKAYIDTYIHRKVDDFGLLLVEKDIEMFKSILRIVDITAIINHPKCYLSVGETPEQVHIILSDIFRATGMKAFIKAANFIEEPAIFTADKDYYLTIIKVFKEAAKDVLIHYGNSPHDSLIGIDHTFVNIDEIIYHPGIKDLKDTFKGKPGIVVSTGPSLNKNIHLLEGLENKAVICCPDASMTVLRKRDLKPHIVTSLERVEATSKLFDGLTEDDTDNVYFAGTPVVHPLTYMKWPGKRICVYRNFSTFKWLDIEKGTLDIGPSAGNMAFELLAFLGCDPIILIGQDLAFAEDGDTHAKGSRFGEKESQDHYKNTLMVPGNYQPLVKTMRIWETFRRCYNISVSKTSSKVINATEGGAKIDGTELMTFQEVIDKYIQDDINVLETIENNLNYPDETEIAENLEKINLKVSEAIEYINEIADTFLEVGRLSDEYLDVIWKEYQEGGKYDMERSKEILAASGDALSICSSEKFYLIAMHYVQSYYIKSMIDVYGVKAKATSAEEEQHDVIEIGRELFYVLYGLLKKMLPMFYNLDKYLKSKTELKEES